MSDLPTVPSGSTRQLQISLFTRSLPPALQIPPQTYLLPSNWKRFQLSQLVNKILSPPQPIPFDFLINGEVLRSSLELWAKRNGRDGEEEGVVEVEYVRSVLPPEEVGRIEQEDWVSGVSLARSG
jgi:ribosome biogenesis protein YTM1